MTKEEFIAGRINETEDSIKQAKAQLKVDKNKPRVSKNLIRLIEQYRVKLLRYEMGKLNEDEEFSLDIINGKAV